MDILFFFFKKEKFTLYQTHLPTFSAGEVEINCHFISFFFFLSLFSPVSLFFFSTSSSSNFLLLFHKFKASGQQFKTSFTKFKIYKRNLSEFYVFCRRSRYQLSFYFFLLLSFFLFSHFSLLLLYLFIIKFSSKFLQA